MSLMKELEGLMDGKPIRHDADNMHDALGAVPEIEVVLEKFLSRQLKNLAMDEDYHVSHFIECIQCNIPPRVLALFAAHHLIANSEFDIIYHDEVEDSDETITTH